MEEYLARLQKVLTSDRTPRVFLMGSAAILALVVISDLAGARDRAPEVRETLRAVQAEREGAPTVPSVASVPRDLASEARLAAVVAEAPEDIVIAEDLAEDEPVEEMAEAEGIEAAAEDIAEADMAQEATEEVAEAEMTEEAAEETAEAEPAAEPVAEAEAAEVAQEASEEVADAGMTEAPADAEDVAEAETAEEATEAMAEAEVAEEAAAEMAEAEADSGDLSLLASADIDNGQRVWRQCAACHVYNAEQNRGGPHLVNIVGREIGVAEGWRYSRALSEHGGVWTVEGLLAWLENPDTYIPGNQMAFRGLRNEQDRIDILGFLNANRAD